MSGSDIRWSQIYATLYNPLDPKDFEGRSAPSLVRWSLDATAALTIKKWHPWCYEMYPALARTLPAAQYNIAGATPAVTQFIAEHGLENRVNYLPLTHDRQTLMGYLDTMNVFAHGSAIGESFGIVIAEAMASGLPVVTHPSRGSQDAQTELVEHGVTGFVVNSPDEYAQAVRSCFPTLRKPSS